MAEGFDDNEEEYDTDAHHTNAGSILKEAIDADNKSTYVYLRSNQNDAQPPKLSLIVKRIVLNASEDYDGLQREISVPIPSLDISIDMLKRTISQNASAVKFLGLNSSKSFIGDSLLGNTKSFAIGYKDEEGDFCPFDSDPSSSLGCCGIANGQYIWIHVDDHSGSRKSLS